MSILTLLKIIDDFFGGSLFYPYAIAPYLYGLQHPQSSLPAQHLCVIKLRKEKCAVYCLTDEKQ